MKHINCILIVVILFFACTQKEKKNITNIFETYHQEKSKLFPFESTLNGDTLYNDIFPNNLTYSYREKLNSFFNTYKEKLNSYDTTSLSDAERLSKKILLFEIENNLNQLSYPEHLMPINQFWGTLQTFISFGSGNGAQPFKSKKDYLNFIKRMEAFRSWSDTAIINMQHGARNSYLYPKEIYEKVLPQLLEVANTPLHENIFYNPLRNISNYVENDSVNELQFTYERTIESIVKPSFKKLATCIEKEILPLAANKSGYGVSQLPNGKNYYQHKVKYWTTVNIDPDSIFKLGLQEVARIHQEMKQLQREMKFKGDLQSFFKFCKDNPAFKPYKSDAAVIERYHQIKSKVEERVTSMFSTIPITKFEIRQTESYREQTASAEYIEGSTDGTRPGIFYIPVLEPEEYNVMSMEALFLHEAIPGHHYQLSLQRENKNLPTFRKTLMFGAYAEGWALYTESLGRDLGLYTEPIQYMGYLTYDIHRAIRLVVDVGIHVKGWSRQQAIEYMIANEPVSEQRAVAEVDRYIIAPGQALSYKIGQLKIISLKEKAKSKLGNKFDLKEFHAQLLNEGSLPLSVLEEKIDKWIEATK